MSIIVKIKRLYGKMFIGGYWKIAYRERNDKDPQYTLIEAPAGTWVADPLLWEEKGEHYLFVELFDKKQDKAGIAYYKFIDGKPIFQKQIIEEPYHLSYPCIFSWKGNVFMIPESAAGKTLDLYKAEHFPDKWIKEDNLIHDEKYVDTTVVEKDGSLFAMGYHRIEKGWGLTLFLLDMDHRKLIKITEKMFSENNGRPAGYILHNELLRPAQDCSQVYGESIIWYQIDLLNSTGFQEHVVTKMQVKDISGCGSPDRIHTYSQDSKYAVVDLRYCTFDLFHGLKTIRRARNGAKGNKNHLS